jgi:hypothetical protein
VSHLAAVVTSHGKSHGNTNKEDQVRGSTLRGNDLQFHSREPLGSRPGVVLSIQEESSIEAQDLDRVGVTHQNLAVHALGLVDRDVNLLDALRECDERNLMRGE